MSFQKCPQCLGLGTIPPPYQMNHISVVCDVCNGKKIISTLTGLPPGSPKGLGKSNWPIPDGNYVGSSNEDREWIISDNIQKLMDEHKE